MEYYSAIKIEWNLTICSNMNGFGGYYAKWNKSEKDKYYMMSLTCKNLKKYNKLVNITKNKQTHSQI